MRYLPLRTSEFYPLTLSMPLEKMLFGAMTLEHRWQKAIDARTGMANKWVEPTVLPNSNLIKAIENLEDNQLLKHNELILAWNSEKALEKKLNSPYQFEVSQDLQEIDFDGDIEIITSLQFMIEHNKEQIVRDTEWMSGSASLTQYPGNQNTFTPPDFILDKITIDERNGPVIIHENVTILPGAKLMGPITLLPYSVIKMGAELYPGTTIGSHVTVDGEVKNSIIHEFSSKGHVGYLGDSILGRWNNLGAGTTVSNVAHSFSTVKISDWNTGNEVHYDTLKRGLITGDFVKLGIMTKTYRGTAIGSFTSIATNDFLKGNIAPFTWWTEKSIKRYHPDKLRLHCQRQMSLKDQTWDNDWESALKVLLENEKEKMNQGK